MSRDIDQSDSGDGPGLIGEEEPDEPVTAQQNLLAAIVIGAVAILAMVMAALLDVPQNLYTAPGLLPFVVGFSLLFMAAALGARAIRDGGARNLFGELGKPGGIGAWMRDEERRRTLLLLAIIAIYIVLIDFFPFEIRQPIGGFELRFSGYELFSIAALTVILRIFWRQPILPCLGVSSGMVMMLASIFRYGFRILLPGLG